MAKILVVEDNWDLQQTVQQALKCENHIVETSDDGLEALQRIETYGYDLIILDLDLPGMNGLEICQRYRLRGGSTLILILTGSSSTEAKTLGLDSGADDYLCKPFGFSELLARVRALLRRAGDSAPRLLQAKNISVDPSSCKVTRDGAPLDLSRKEFALLETFLRSPERVFTVKALARNVWGDLSDDCIASVRTHIKTLRKKIDTEGETSMISTVHGVGYKLNTD